MADSSSLLSPENIEAARVSVGAALTLAGAVFSAAGTVGVLRFPDFYTRMHAASVTDTLGASLALIGMMLIGGLSLVTFKLVAIWVFFLVTSPTASNAAANGALKAGLQPFLGKWTGQKITVEGQEALKAKEEKE